MASVLQFHRTLSRRPEVPAAPTIAGTLITTRRFRGLEDVAVWLELRQRAFAGLSVGIGAWSPRDFEREFLSKPWWSPERMWFARPEGHERDVGTITLGLRGEGEAAKPVIHWLCVDPRWRRRGIGRRLVAELELACWESGSREIHLETHVKWTAAVGLYRALGYRAVGESQ